MIYLLKAPFAFYTGEQIEIDFYFELETNHLCINWRSILFKTIFRDKVDGLWYEQDQKVTSRSLKLGKIAQNWIKLNASRLDELYPQHSSLIKSHILSHND